MRRELDRRPPFAAVHDIVDRRDPERLLLADMPEDEYDVEVADIADRLREGKPMTPELLTDIWEHAFGPGSEYVARASPQELAAFAAELDELR